MLQRSTKTGLAVLLMCIAPALNAQYATEVFIPLGQSPGLSGTLTTQGQVHSVDTQNKTLTVIDGTGQVKITMNEKTRVWLDQSHLKLNNKQASIEDIGSGMTAEIKYINNKNNIAEWVKIRKRQ